MTCSTFVLARISLGKSVIILLLFHHHQQKANTMQTDNLSHVLFQIKNGAVIDHIIASEKTNGRKVSFLEKTKRCRTFLECLCMIKTLKNKNQKI